MHLSRIQEDYGMFRWCLVQYASWPGVAEGRVSLQLPKPNWFLSSPGQIFFFPLSLKKPTACVIETHSCTNTPSPRGSAEKKTPPHIQTNMDYKSSHQSGKKHVDKTNEMFTKFKTHSQWVSQSYMVMTGNQMSVHLCIKHILGQTSSHQESQERAPFFQRLAMFVWHLGEKFFRTRLYFNSELGLEMVLQCGVEFPVVLRDRSSQRYFRNISMGTGQVLAISSYDPFKG